MRGDHAGRPRHALAAAPPVRRLGDVRARARAPDLAVVQRPQPDLRHRRGRCRRPAAAPARRADPHAARCRCATPACSARAGARSRTASRNARRPGGAGAASSCWRSPQQGTPRYVYDLATVRERARSLTRVARGRPLLLRDQGQSAPGASCARIAGEGFGLECVSQGEFEHVFATLPELDAAAACCSRRASRRAREYEAAFARGVIVTLDNIEALQRWPEVFRGRTIWLRIDLGHGEGHHEKVRTGGVAAKFGLPMTRFDAFIARGAQARRAHQRPARAPGQRHRGSAALARRVRAPGRAGRQHRHDRDDRHRRRPADPVHARGAGRSTSALWRGGLDEIKAAYPRYGAGDRAGPLPGRRERRAAAARVTQVVEKDGVRRIGCDAGMNALMRPAMYEAYHGIFNLSRLDDGETRGVRRGRPDLRNQRRARPRPHACRSTPPRAT